MIECSTAMREISNYQLCDDQTAIEYLSEGINFWHNPGYRNARIEVCKAANKLTNELSLVKFVGVNK